MMRTEEPQTIRLEDYRAPDWLIDTVNLDIALHPTRTRVRAKLAMRPNSEASPGARPLVLDGDGIGLVDISLDGERLGAETYTATPDRLTIAQPPKRAITLEIESILDPSANTQLMGLYRSNGVYCTQCEAEGFRRITYFLDRPDVMAVYTTRIEAEHAEAPVLLSNGNLVESGTIPGATRHYAVWHDPFPKPSYLFAMVGGDLAHIEDRFVTQSGRDVTLRIYVEHGKEGRCAYAMDALKRSMRWDEKAFGREYDLDIFMIVAVSDFNMGAMENKGLNVFNDKYVLASPETATDADYASIEAIIAHEYFHNWTGNRITCRDWFQLCLKEGLTVFRDQEFSADQRSAALERIADVRNLRAIQFVEDAGPMAHAVRPNAYREINNFYTPTIYEKGAEIIRMLRTLLGADDFRRGIDLYFVRHDGHAATIEQFIACFAEASGRDLQHFSRWYEQAGTPQVMATINWDDAKGIFRLDLAQSTAPTPGQPDKQPQVIPLLFALLDTAGAETSASAQGLARKGLIVLDQKHQSFEFTGLEARPALSINRQFSAPINLSSNASEDDTQLLAAHDRDPFNRWQAIQTLALKQLVAQARGADAGSDAGLIMALRNVLSSSELPPAFVAQAMSLPTDADVARELRHDVDPDAIFIARTKLRLRLGTQLADVLHSTYLRLSPARPYSPDAARAGERALRNACLDLMVASAATAHGLALSQFDKANNMTDRIGALAALLPHDVPERGSALDRLYEIFQSDPLVIDKWFALQATIPDPGTLDRVQALTRHPAFSFVNPNRVRSLIGMFGTGNLTQFNRQDGRGYAFVVDTALALDEQNPQLAARLMGAFKNWRSMESGRRAATEATLRRAAERKNLSRDLADILQRSLTPLPAGGD